jgi:hypothetical protein
VELTGGFLLPALSENGLATEKGLEVMVETLGVAVGKNIHFRRSAWWITFYCARCDKSLEFDDKGIVR